MKNGWTAAMIIVLALCIGAAVAAFAGVTPDLAAPSYALAVLLALMWVGKLFTAKAVSWKHSPLHIPILGFVAYAVARYFFSPLEYEARLEFVGIGCCALVYFIAASNFYRARDRAWFIWALLLGAIPVVVLSGFTGARPLLVLWLAVVADRVARWHNARRRLI